MATGMATGTATGTDLISERSGVRLARAAWSLASVPRQASTQLVNQARIPAAARARATSGSARPIRRRQEAAMS